VRENPQNGVPIPRLKRKTAVVFSSYYGDLGGGELRLLEHLTLTRMPRESLSAVLFEHGPFADRIRDLGIAVDEIRWSLATRKPLRWVQTPWANFQLRRHLHSHAAGLVFCNTYNDLLCAGKVARQLNIPVVWRSHADVFPYLPQRNQSEREAIVKIIEHTTRRILTTTYYDRELMLREGIDAEKVHVVPLGVDLASFARRREEGARFRNELGLLPSDFVIGFVARLIPQKGHLVFFEALAKVVGDFPETRAIVVGDSALNDTEADEYRRSLQDRVASLNLANRVIFTGFKDDVAAVMNAIDLFVHSSLKEPFGSVIVEAMAASKPVIASATLGPREIIDDGVTGLLSPAGDPDALAERMALLLRDKTLARRLGEDGRRYVAQKYDLSETIRLLDGHFLDTLNSCGTTSNASH
jgi:glycosyltransferase involved in cell wall biosynthesis